MRLSKVWGVVGATAVLALVGCQPSPKFEITYEQYQLDNGLSVVLHQDRSDPITAVAILYHVGSGREEVGRTGFAHLFEHMMFQSSQHVGEDQFFQKVQAAGGTLNGGTSFDQTVYYEVVPNNALELALWLESDRMGYLLPTVTQEAFVNQQAVVQNEKRQGVDNVPYGHTSYVIGKLLYPEGHPYNWQVIGSFDDLANASVEDVRNFFRHWYGPNNATLVIAGDFDATQAKAWVEKYFGEISSSAEVPDPEPQPVTLGETRRAYFEDNFGRSAEINIVRPTVEEYHPDAYALSMLADLFADGRKAPLYQVIVEDEKLAPSVSAFQSSREVSGEFRIRIRAFPGKSLDDVEAAVGRAFAKFEQDRFTEADLDRIKSQVETGFYNGISSVLGKSFQLAAYNEFAGSPSFIQQDIQNYLDVTSDDVWRVYEQYVKDKPAVITSFVPRGHAELATSGSERFDVPLESITAAGAGVGGAGEGQPVEPLASNFDRSVEPEKGPAPTVTLPTVWTHTYENGLRLYGIEQHELPLVQYQLTMQGGHLLDTMDKMGVANLMTDIMMAGTANKTPIELEEAIDALGASISMFTGDEQIAVRANGLKSKMPDITGLFQEILLEPRWDSTELARIKDETVETINRRSISPGAVAGKVFDRLVYGERNVLGHDQYGTPDQVRAITMDDLRRFYDANYSPSVAHIAVAGDISESEAIALFQPLADAWPAKAVSMPEYPAPTPQDRTRLYFVDIPGSAQSQIYVGQLGLRRTDPDYYAATVMNYALGGSFNGVLNMILREEKGYTYGARSFFSGSREAGVFLASSSVRSNATYESVQIVRDELDRYRRGIDQGDLDFTKDALIQSNARRFETLGALVGMLNEIASYDLPVDYVRQEEQTIRDMTLERHQALAQQYIQPDRMIYLVVGDARTQASGLRGLGLGAPIMLDVNGERMR